MSKSPNTPEGASKETTSNANLIPDAEKVIPSYEDEATENPRKLEVLVPHHLEEVTPPFKYFTVEDEDTLSPIIESKSNKLFHLITKLVNDQKKDVMKALDSKGGWITLNKENPKVLLRHLKQNPPPPPPLTMAPVSSAKHHASLSWPENGIKFEEEKLSKLRLVFEAGWKRETVITPCGTKGQNTMVVRYYSPTRLMLSSPQEVERWLKENEPDSPFTLDNFSFERVRISQDPDEEIVREMFPLESPAPIEDILESKSTSLSNLEKPRLISGPDLSSLSSRVLTTTFKRLAVAGRELPMSPSTPYALEPVNPALPELHKKWFASENKRGNSKGKSEDTPMVMAPPWLSKKLAVRQENTTAMESSPNVSGRVSNILNVEEAEEFELQDNLTFDMDVDKDQN